MSTLKNSVQLMGNVGQTPEVVNLESGKKLAKFSLATNEFYYNNDGEKVTNTYWHNIVAWGKTAEIIEKYVEKGREVIIQGKLAPRSYEDKNGEKRYFTEVNCNEIVLPSKNSQAINSPNPSFCYKGFGELNFQLKLSKLKLEKINLH